MKKLSDEVFNKLIELVKQYKDIKLVERSRFKNPYDQQNDSYGEVLKCLSDNCKVRMVDLYNEEKKRLYPAPTTKAKAKAKSKSNKTEVQTPIKSDDLIKNE